jgi:hypothetical protein
MHDSIHPDRPGAQRSAVQATWLLWLAIGLILCMAAASGTAQSNRKATPGKIAKNFPIFDNMAYKEKPDTAPDGLIPSDVLYQKDIWPNPIDAGTLPDRAAFQSLVRSKATNPGPLVIDIETISLRGSVDMARYSMATLAKLADWAHQTVPGKVVGFYSTNIFADIPPANLDIARELARHVDAFFPPMYSFDDDRARWEQRAQVAEAQARALDAHKPIYFYLWPQFHVGSARAMRYVPGDFWKFELQTAHRCSDGIVLWGSNTYVWNPKSGWWAATQEFAASLR